MTAKSDTPPDEDEDLVDGAVGTYWRWLGILLGLGSFFAILLAPDVAGLSVEGQRLAAVTVLMAIFWVAQPIPIAATSLMPLALYPLLGILSAKDVSKAYADQNVFLFLGGFLIAIAIERWQLHRRIALSIISIVGSSPRMIVFGFMLTTAALSMWISNTAAALLMLPIGLALVSTLRDSLTDIDSTEADRIAAGMSVPLLLGIAYAASIGGFATLVGTPTNLSLRGFWERQFVTRGYPEISFAEWIVVFTPVSALMLTSAAIVMTWHIKPLPNAERLSRNFFRVRLRNLGPATGSEWRVGIIFLTTALLWVFRRPLKINQTEILPDWPGLLAQASARMGLDLAYLATSVEDSTIAIAMALLLFVLPGEPDARGRRPRLLTWGEAGRGTPWGMLLLFGGGFAIADAFTATNLSDWLGNCFSGVFSGQPTLVLVIGVCTLVTFLTEFTSNTATINTLLPILAAMAVELKFDPRVLMIPATISASCGFMLPVATPPNAIVFGSGKVPMRSMISYGLILNFLGVIYVTLAMWCLASPVMHIPLRAIAE
jgi:sodium-dependent dicarboxylate transporter 2/3/5